MKKWLLLTFTFILTFTLAACNDDKNATEDTESIKDKVHEYSVGNFDDVTASITSHELIVNEDGKEKRFDLPEDEFFVSIAPFVDYTHECAIHSLTGCQGELVEQDFDVLIQDEAGKVVVDETITSLRNGFIDLWLPRDQEYQVQIKYDDKTVESTLSTFKDDNTCITTMHLT